MSLWGIYHKGWLLCWKKELELVSVKLCSLKRLCLREMKNLETGDCDKVVGRGVWSQVVGVKHGVSR